MLVDVIFRDKMLPSLRHSTSFLVGVSLLLAVAHPSQAQDGKSIIDQLAKSDQRLLDGQIEYEDDVNTKVNNQPFTQKTRTILKYQNPNRVWVKKDDGKVQSSFFYDGQDLLNFTSPGFVSIDPTAPFELDPSGYLLDIALGPSFPLGRGLSKLKDLKVTSNGSTVQLEGTGEDKTTYIAVLDEKRDFLAHRIERIRNNSKVRTIYELTNPLLPKHGPWIASQANYRVIRENGEVAYEKNFRVLNADFSRPDDSLFTYIFPPDIKVSDSRFGKGVLLQGKRAAPMTKDQIAVITKQLEAQQEKVLAQTASYERQEYQRRFRNIAIFSVLTLLILVPVGFRLRSSSKH